MNKIYFKDKYLKDTKTRIKEVLRVVLVIIAILAVVYCIPVFHTIRLANNRICKYDVVLKGSHAIVGRCYPLENGAETVKIPSLLYGRPVTEVMEYSWKDYQGNAKIIYLPETLTRIGHGAFYGNMSIEEIYAPNVKSIVYSAFGSAEKLHTVNFGNRLETIGAGAFKGCKNLRHFEYPKSLRLIEREAFRDSGIENIPENNDVRICEGAFCNTPWEKNNREVFVTFDYYYYEYDKTMNTFLRYNGKENTVIIPAGVEILGCECKYTEGEKECTIVNEVFLPDTVTELRRNILIGQEHLTMYIPDSVENIWNSNASIERIVTIKGSYAESFAKENDIPVESLSEEEFWSRYPESAKEETKQ